MSQQRAILSGQWEFQLIEDNLFITSEDDPGHQVALTAAEAYDLLEYLYMHHEELYEASHPEQEKKTDGNSNA